MRNQHPFGARKTDSIGVVGLVISLVGFCGNPFLCPVGAIVSAWGLLFKPRILSVAGLAMGLLGTLFLVFYGTGFFLDIWMWSLDRLSRVRMI